MIVVRELENPEDDGMRYSNTGFLYVTKTKAGPNGSIMVQFSEQKANITSFGEMMKNRTGDNFDSESYLKVNTIKNEPEEDEKW
jgi:hypothetical protein